MTISIDPVPGHPNWCVEYTRTQGCDDEAYWVFEGKDGFAGGGRLLGIAEDLEEAIRLSEEETGEVKQEEEVLDE